MNVFEHLEGFVSGKLSIIKTVVSLIQLETRLAGLSVYPLLLNLCMLFIVLMAVWLSTMLLLGYLFLFLFDNTFAAILFILFLNVVLLVLLLKYLMFNLKKMSFEKTRAYFSNKESSEHDKLEKTINC